MHKQRLAVTIAAVVGMVCTFLPWAHVPLVGSIDGTRGDGWITLVLCAVTLTCALVGNLKTPLATGVMITCIVLGVITALIAFWDLMRINDVAGDSPFVSIGAGLYLLVAAGVAIALLSPILHQSPVRQPPAPQPPWQSQAQWPQQQPYPGSWQPPSR